MTAAELRADIQELQEMLPNSDHRVREEVLALIAELEAWAKAMDNGDAT